MSSIIVLRAFMRRDWATEISYRTAFVLQLVSILLTLALFFYLGRVVDQAEFSGPQGFESGYFGFVVVGLALLEIVQAGLTSFSTKIREEQTTGTLEALMATPTGTSLIVMASAAFDLLRATIFGLVVLLVAIAVFGLDLDTDPASVATAIAALAGCVGLFAALGISLAAFTIVFQRATGMLGLIVSGLALLGGVYFPIEVLPEPLRTLAEAFPFTWGLEVARGALLGGQVELGKLAALCLSAVFLIPVALVLFAAAVRHARRAGTLAQY